MTELGVVRRKVTRAERAAVEALGRYGVATVHEAMGRVGLMKPYSGRFIRGVLVSGWRSRFSWTRGQLDDACRSRTDRARRHRRRSDHRRLHRRLFRRSFGNELHGPRGKALIIDAGVRDVKTLIEMGFPVWSKCISAKGTVKSTLGSVTIPIVCAGVAVNPGCDRRRL